ncbi:MAG: hypothetical protein JSW35_00870, partial [Deltaproteobacteria bacterium]
KYNKETQNNSPTITTFKLIYKRLPILTRAVYQRGIFGKSHPSSNGKTLIRDYVGLAKAVIWLAVRAAPLKSKEDISGGVS